MGKQCDDGNRDAHRDARMALARALARATRATTTATTAARAAARAAAGRRAMATTDATTATDGDDGARTRERAMATRDDAIREARATATMAPTARTATGATLEDGGLGSRVMEMWLMAVPKRKVTPSRRKRRNQFKRLPFVESVVRCGVCGKVNLPHVRCCDVAREARKGGGEETPGTSP
jgi:large subunit ribosomal protein L32